MIGATHLAFLAESLGPSRSCSSVSGNEFIRIWYIWMLLFSELSWVVVALAFASAWAPVMLTNTIPPITTRIESTSNSSNNVKPARAAVLRRERGEVDVAVWRRAR